MNLENIAIPNNIGTFGRDVFMPRTPTKLRLDQTCLDSLCAFGAGSVTLHPSTDGAARRPYQADAVDPSDKSDAARRVLTMPGDAGVDFSVVTRSAPMLI
jgi:hypothetical protein